LRRALVVPDGLWTGLVLHTETGSTNADAAEAARSGAPEGLVVIAERQTAGRGRRGRSWESPARAGIAVSVLLRPGVAVPDRDWPAVPAARHGWLPLLAGVALVETVSRLAELRCALKWPNDLLVWPRPPSSEGEAKCAGILAEGVTTGGEEPAVVLGIGLNVTLRSDELPVNPTGLPATSLRLAGAATTDRDPLLRELLRGVERWYGRWRAAGGDARGCGLHEAYVRNCATLGRRVRVLVPAGNDVVGVATGIDVDGQLVLDTAAGERRLAAGDVLHLR
jgi:BirA family biotin operon repressor/biotin-[acetyl-CoA-carboxylase] ligase